MRWSLLFAILAASTLQVRHFALVRLHVICPRVSIDAPSEGDTVSSHLVVRGHVASDAVTRPVWIIARAVAADRGCRDQQIMPIIPGPFGAFAVGLDLDGGGGRHYRLEVVSADEVANDWLQSRPERSDRCRLLAEAQVAATCCHDWSAAPPPRLPSGTTVLASMVVVLSGEARPRCVTPRRGCLLP